MTDYLILSIILTIISLYLTRMRSDKVYVESREKLSRIAQRILEPVKNDESGTVVWFPATGKSIILSEIFNSRRTLKEELGDRFDKTLFLLVDVNSIITEARVVGFFQLLLLSMRPKAHQIGISFQNEIGLLQEIKYRCQQLLKRGLRIVFVIDDIETVSFPDQERIIQGIANLICVNRNRVHAVLNLVNLDTLPILEKNQKNYTLLQNLIFIPLPTKEETKHFIDVFQGRWNFKPSSKEKEILSNFEGNNLLTKAALRILKRQKILTLKQLLDQREIKLKAQIFFNQIGKKEKQVLERVVFRQEEKQRLGFAKNYLTEIGVLRKGGRRVTIHPPILDYLVKINNQGAKIQINEKGEIVFGACRLSRILSPREYRFLELLYQNRGKVCFREKVAKQLWGKNYLDRYSDWNLDQVVSRARQKLSSVGIPRGKIATKKGKGWSLGFN